MADFKRKSWGACKRTCGCKSVVRSAEFQKFGYEEAIIGGFKIHETLAYLELRIPMLELQL